MALVDALSRLVPGVVGRAEAVENDSFYRGFLDHPHFTRPAVWREDPVPEVLAGGDHGAIETWRRREGVRRTLTRRPDVLARAGLRPDLEHGVYVLLLHHPLRDLRGDRGVAAVHPEELRDLARTCRTYGVRRLLVAHPQGEQRDRIRSLQLPGTEGRPDGDPSAEAWRLGRLPAAEWVGVATFPRALVEVLRAAWNELKGDVPQLGWLLLPLVTVIPVAMVASLKPLA